METQAPPAFKAPRPRTFFAWRILRTFLLTVAVLVTFVAGFYSEENWRGKRAWDNCRHELEAHGGVFDWNTRVPPPVPEDQNFFGDPEMAEWFAGRRTNDLSRGLDDPRTHAVSLSGTNGIQTIEEAHDYLSWSGQFLPEFGRIREALKLPYARIDCDYGQPMTVLAPNFATIRNLAQTLSQRAHCFLLLNEPEKALPELTLLHDLCRILECAPTRKPITLVGAMINVAVTGLYADTVAEGVRSHVWREAQLVALEQQLSEIHLETSIAETLIDEPMSTLRTLETSSRGDLLNLFAGSSETSNRSALLLKHAPRGWLCQYMVVHARLTEKFSDGFDAKSQIVVPNKIDDAGRLLRYDVDHVRPYTFLAYWTIPNWVKVMQRFAANQTMANQGAVACAAERYRLNHGEYPKTLDELVPQFIDKLPHDLIGGQPYTYRRIGNTQFLLYSIGWNCKDDGGFPGQTIGEGDWVWGQSAQAIAR